MVYESWPISVMIFPESSLTRGPRSVQSTLASRAIRAATTASPPWYSQGLW